MQSFLYLIYSQSCGKQQNNKLK